MSVKSTIKAGALRPTKNTVFVTDMEEGPRLTKGGLIIPDDNMKDRGIRCRWSRVYAVGPEVDDLAPGDWVLTEHGRWTPGIEMELAGQSIMLWRLDYPAATLLATDSDPRAAKTHRFA